MYLRSGQLQTPPIRIYQCPYQIFYKEQLPQKLGQGIGINMAGIAISKEWADLSQEEHDHYQEMYQKLELKFQEELLHFYGGTDQEFQSFKEFKNLPKQPTQPILPQIRYVYENREKFREDNIEKNYTARQIQQELIEEYGRQDIEVKRKFEREYEEKCVEYQHQIENWNNEYADKQKNLKRTLEEKFKKHQSEVKFEYKELNFPRTVRKISQKSNLINHEECGMLEQINIRNVKLEDKKGKINNKYIEQIQVNEKGHQKKQRRHQ